MILGGVILCFLTPPYQMGDEVVHFGRAWQISEGIFSSPTATVSEVVDNPYNGATQAYIQWGTGGLGLPPHVQSEKMLVAEVPSSMVPMEILRDYHQRAQQHSFSLDMVAWYIDLPFQPELRETMLIPNAGVYFPLLYFPQAVGAWVGRAAGCSAGIIYYLMRLSALAFVTVCVFFSMKLLPEKKTLLFLLAVMPMFLGEATAISADTLLYGICFWGTAWLLSLRRDKLPLTSCEMAGLFLFAVVVGLSKQVYGIILILYFMIPSQRVGSQRKFWIMGLSLLAVSLLASTMWVQYAVTGRGTELLAASWLGADILAQKAFVFAHPGTFAEVIARSIWLEKTEHAKAFIGWLGLNAFIMPKWFNWAYAFFLAIGALVGDLRLTIRQRLLMISAFLLTVPALFIVWYLLWTPVGGEQIFGVQGRYFIPVALLLFCSFSCVSSFKYEKVFSIAAGLFSMVTTLWVTYEFFYGA